MRVAGIPGRHFSVHAGHHQALPLTETYADRTVTLPLFAHMTDQQQDLVIEAVAKAVRPESEPTPLYSVPARGSCSALLPPRRGALIPARRRRRLMRPVER